MSLVEASIAAAAWEAAEYLATGSVPQPLGNLHRLNAPYQLFETRDTRYLAIGTPNDGLFARLMQVLGLAAHVADPRFATYASRKAHEAPLLDKVVFEGNKRIKDTELSPGIESKPRGSLQRAVVQSDVNQIVEAYRHLGRDDVSVTDRGSGPPA